MLTQNTPVTSAPAYIKANLDLASSTIRPDCAPFLSVKNRLVFIPTNILNFSVAKLLASKAA